MPNYCCYNMQVTGEKKENIEEFIQVLQADYNYRTKEFTAPRHMFRVFTADPSDIVPYHGKYACNIVGDCAWSVYSCMMEGPFSYYSEVAEEHPDDFRGTTLIKESELLDLDIEVFSEEPGMGFAEHYLISKGDKIIDEEEPLQTYYFDEEEDSYEEFQKNTGCTMSKDELMDEYDGWYTIGGFNQVFAI